MAGSSGPPTGDELSAPGWRRLRSLPSASSAGSATENWAACRSCPGALPSVASALIAPGATVTQQASYLNFAGSCDFKLRSRVTHLNSSGHPLSP